MPVTMRQVSCLLKAGQSIVVRLEKAGHLAGRLRLFLKFVVVCWRFLLPSKEEHSDCKYSCHDLSSGLM
jgi:hypothetical protein